MKITMVRSSNGCTQRQKDNLRSLNLKKIGHYAIVEDTNEMIGRIKKVKHLLMVEKE